MYNSMNYPSDVTYPIKQESKPVKPMVDRLTYSELQALNLVLARRDYILAMREQRKSALAELEGNWIEVLTA